MHCFESLEDVSRRASSDEISTPQTKKLLNPYQHLKIEFWIKALIESRRERPNPAVSVTTIRRFLSQFDGNELLHRVSLISQNLFSELLVRLSLLPSSFSSHSLEMDEDEETRQWGEGTLDLIHQFIWEFKMARTPPIHFLYQDDRTGLSSSTSEPLQIAPVHVHPSASFVPSHSQVHSSSHSSSPLVQTMKPSKFPYAQTIFNRPGASFTEEIALLKSQIGMSKDRQNTADTNTHLTFSEAVPNHLDDLIYWQWTVSHPTSGPSTSQPIRPPAPSPTQTAGKGQQLLSHHHLEPVPGLDPLVSYHPLHVFSPHPT
jgi:hypothetical protein